ncbi:hypothetical protein DVS28_a0914 [Euzebya pacifica]|uniref:Uncharacterized protein n=1 Tax=Euzebya pacifica TaxID=1608957 RepID=A0A346XTR8_9ACTN|nr:hypothetical protein DVS28_a0914 [Euzebya pacifica]
MVPPGRDRLTDAPRFIGPRLDHLIRPGPRSFGVHRAFVVRP